MGPTEVPMDRWTQRVYRSLDITPTDLGPDRTGVEKCKAKMKKDNVAEVVFSTPYMGRQPRSDAHSMLLHSAEEEGVLACTIRGGTTALHEAEPVHRLR